MKKKLSAIATLVVLLCGGASPYITPVSAQQIPTQCTDGIDNDSDFFIDMNDTGCADVADDSEANASTTPPSSTSAGTVDIKVNGSDGPVSITYGNSGSLSWTSTGTVTGCNLGQYNQAGTYYPVNPTGSQTTGALTQSITFEINCNNGSVTDTVAVTVPSSTPTT